MLRTKLSPKYVIFTLKLGIKWRLDVGFKLWPLYHLGKSER
jgi:hypothetical protein